MEKRTLILSELEYALQYWEDVNLHSELFFKLKKEKSIEYHEYLEPLVGSESDEYGIIRRAIKNFKGFRSCVENNLKLDPYSFLPRVPAEYRETYNQSDFMRSYYMSQISAFPYMLSKWLETKRVFSIDCVCSIPYTDLSVDNYFSKLPYGSFCLKINHGIVIEKICVNMSGDETLDPIEIIANIILISSDGNKVDLFFIPENIHTMLMDSKTRNSFNEYLKYSKVSDRKVNKLEYLSFLSKNDIFYGLSIDIETGLPIAKNYRKNDEEITIVYDCDDVDFKFKDKSGKMSPEEVDLSLKEEFAGFSTNEGLPDLINAFCKMIAELPSKKVIILEEESKKQNHTTKFSREYPWHSVPVCETRSTEDQEEIGIIFIGKGHGSEKCPHPRRGHPRIYRNPDGSIRIQKWIEPKMIRADKLETENLKGSATILKDKKE